MEMDHSSAVPIFVTDYKGNSSDVHLDSWIPLIELYYWLKWAFDWSLLHGSSTERAPLWHPVQGCWRQVLNSAGWQLEYPQWLQGKRCLELTQQRLQRHLWTRLKLWRFRSCFWDAGQKPSSKDRWPQPFFCQAASSSSGCFSKVCSGSCIAQSFTYSMSGRVRLSLPLPLKDFAPKYLAELERAPKSPLWGLCWKRDFRSLCETAWLGRQGKDGLMCGSAVWACLASDPESEEPLGIWI